MTNELEKQFFDTFGIEPITHAVWDSTETKWKNFESWEEYPQISDRILLELICILSQHYSWEEENWFIERTTIEELKEWLLEVFIEIDKIGLSKIIKHQVRTLFEEGEE